MESIFYDNSNVELLAEIYSLNELHQDIIVESIKTTHMYQMYHDVSILTEGFSDIMSNISNFFKVMIEKIKEFFKKVLMIINSCFMDIDKFVKKYKKELDSLEDINFDIQGYKWTLHEAPDMSEFNQIVSDYNSDLADVPKMKKADILKRQNEYLDAHHMNELRGKILGNKQAIEEDDFHEVVRKYYRDGADDTEAITIDTSKFRQIISEVETLVKAKKDAEKTRDELLILLSKTEKFFSQKATYVYNGGVKQIKASKIKTDDNKLTTDGDQYTNYSESTVTTMETFIRFKYNQVNKVASMINLVASERANAYKDQVKFSREVIKKGLMKPNENNTDKEDK